MKPVARFRDTDLYWDQGRGTAGMLLFIITEVVLFLMLYFGYFYLGERAPVWPPVRPDPGLGLAMLVVFLIGTAALYWSARLLRQERRGAAETGLTAALVLGLLFLVLQAMELRRHTAMAAPHESAYSSIMVAINGLHALHVFAGLLMVGYVALLLPRLAALGRPLRRPLVNVILYWDFLAALWVVTLVLLYLLPYLTGSGP